MNVSAESRRLAAADAGTQEWRFWGPYLAGRQWGTVREDYSADGDAWASFPFDDSHRRAYRWGEDGIAGLSDQHGFLALGLALWNGHDDRLKERYFGLTNSEGNHGEDVKEYWWHLDATPTHSYAQTLYRYPQQAFPYAALIAENARRGRDVDEFELADTGILEGNRFFDVRVVHAKAAPDDICVEIQATNEGPDPAPLHLVPQLWFRNTWAWGRDDRTPSLRLTSALGEPAVVDAHHDFLGDLRLEVEDPEARALFCDNETDDVALFGTKSNPTPWPKDGIDRAIVHGDDARLNPAQVGTKVGLHRVWEAVGPGESVRLRLRLRRSTATGPAFDDGPSSAADSSGAINQGAGAGAGSDLAFDDVLTQRRAEADAFYAEVIPAHVDELDRLVARRAFAGLLWCKQHYRYSINEWLAGDPAQPPPPPSRTAPEPAARNTSWRTLALADVISMPDEWEYPWFASWDLAFHCVTLAHIDPAFAKAQLLLMTREWAQHPDGALPAYEWQFSDVNPPVHAWAAWEVYVIDGATDHDFLVRVMTKLLMNFSWWLNRKDPDGSNLFAGGFLGLDNIGLFDRSRDVPDGWRLEQSDATSWMAFYSLSMMRIAVELGRRDPAWSDLVTTFLERFCAIAEAMEAFGSQGVSLWDEEDGFFYDALIPPEGAAIQLRVRSLVGLLPLLAVGVLPVWASERLPELTEHLGWLERHRPELVEALVAPAQDPTVHRMLRLIDPDRLTRLLHVMLDEHELLSPYGVRSLSAAYRDGFSEQVEGQELGLRYDPGESSTGLFGGNSNWRGPVWFPVNALLVDALRTHAIGLGDGFTIELPTGSGRMLTLSQVAEELEGRLIALFRPGPDGHRPGDQRDHGTGPLWSGHLNFSEYFHGDTGRGLGASHQTGWTALVAHLIVTSPPPTKGS